MLKSYFKIAIRNLSGNRLTSFINIFGLGLSMSVGLMIMIRFQDQLGYDKFHPAANRTYRITSEYHKKNDIKWNMASTPLPLEAVLVKQTGVVKNTVNIYPALNAQMTAGGKELSVRGAFTSPAFFDVFGFKLQRGDAATALSIPNAIVISQSLAERFFGKENPVGQLLKMESTNGFLVTGVLSNAPGKSHLEFDAYASSSSINQLEKNKVLAPKSEDWYAFNASYTYVVLKKGSKASAVQAQLNQIARELNMRNQDAVSAFNLQTLNSITPGGAGLSNNIGTGSSWTKMYVEGGMALLILLAACFNYTNLTIARALTRAKEVGVRKIVGAKRSQIFSQYIIESVVLSLLALGFAWIILSLIVRYAPFNDGYEFIPSSFSYNNTYITRSVIYAVFTGLLAGTSPAWILSAFKPLRVLKNLSTAKIMGKIGLQKSLVVFQYSLSLTILIFLFVFYKQFSFLADTNPGYKTNNVLVLPLQGINPELAAQKVTAVSGVTKAAGSSAKFDARFSGTNAAVWISDKDAAPRINFYYAGANFISSMGFKMAAGNNFPSQNNLENKERYILLNERAALALGFSNATKALGEKIWVNDTTQLEISGVLHDFIYEGAGRPVAPLAFRDYRAGQKYLYVHTTGSENKSLLDKVTASIAPLAGKKAVEASWLADDLEKSNSQTATISLLGFLGFIALAIASLGLLGLVIYTVEVKGKEISIRKIIGANEKQIVKLLSTGYVKLLFTAGLIAMPIGWIMGTLFLQNFSHRIHFGIGTVIMCFSFLLGIGLFTIMSQTYKAAISNPVKSLRAE